MLSPSLPLVMSKVQTEIEAVAHHCVDHAQRGDRIAGVNKVSAAIAQLVDVAGNFHGRRFDAYGRCGGGSRKGRMGTWTSCITNALCHARHARGARQLDNILSLVASSPSHRPSTSYILHHRQAFLAPCKKRAPGAHIHLLCPL